MTAVLALQGGGWRRKTVFNSSNWMLELIRVLEGACFWVVFVANGSIFHCFNVLCFPHFSSPKRSVL